jgi:hypothetical protein
VIRWLLARYLGAECAYPEAAAAALRDALERAE